MDKLNTNLKWVRMKVKPEKIHNTVYCSVLVEVEAGCGVYSKRAKPKAGRGKHGSVTANTQPWDFDALLTTNARLRGFHGLAVRHSVS